MKIIIFGANELGSMIASELYTENDITVVDDERYKTDVFNKLMLVLYLVMRLI